MLKRLFLHYVAEETRPMLRLAIPLVLAELGWMTMAIVDTMMVGRQAHSAEAIGAVSLGSILFASAAIFGTGLMLGLDTLVSHSYGSGDIEDCHRSMVNGLYLCLAISPVLMGIIYLFERVLRHLNIPEPVLAQAIPYLRTLNWGTFPLLAFFVFRRYLQGMNLAKPVMFALISANLVNLLGNWALIYGHLGFPAMGVRGSALSTVFARILMAASMLGFAWRYERKRGHPLFHHWAAPQVERIQQLIRLGLPAAVQITLEVGAWNMATLSAGFLNPIALATHQIALNYASVTYMVPLGISAAAAVSVGHALGAGDKARARRAGWLAAGLGSGFMLLAGIAFFIVHRTRRRNGG